MSNNVQKVVVTKRGIGFCGLLFIVLLLLKVGVIKTAAMGWSWWWITSPLWAPTCLVLGIIALVLVVMLITVLGGLLVASIIDKYEKRKQDKAKEKRT